MRNWLMAVTLDSLGNLYHVEPFADSLKLSRPMDMFFDKNGSLWLIEYGTRWYSSNEDARLSRIDFIPGNRAPVAVLEADKTAAAAPASISFSLSKSMDYDGVTLSFTLDFGDKSAPVQVKSHNSRQLDPELRHSTAKSDSLKIEHRFERPGLYRVTLKACDESGACSSQSIQVRIGNEAPKLYWDLVGHNRSFYRPGDTLHYRLVVEDREDGSLANGGIALEAIKSSLEFLEKGANPNAPEIASAQPVAPDKYIIGKGLIEQSDCKNCHAVDRQINGPAYQAIAARYRDNKTFAVPTISYGKSFMAVPAIGDSPS